MSGAQGPRPARAKGWRHPGAIAGLILVAAGSLWNGCTVTPKNYKVLSFFFDGVPDPSLAAKGITIDKDGKVRVTMVSVHKPYADENCEACHKSGFRPSKSNGSLCLPCHPKVQTAHERMHGPVAVGACLWCHTGHESIYPHLLRDSDRKVCQQCHTAEMIDSTRVPGHADATKGCLECHFGHGGGAGRFMLREPGAAAELPEPPAAGRGPEK